MCYGTIAPMARDDPQVNFRMPAELKSRLEQAAQASGRSLTQEIVRRLEQSLQPDVPAISRQEIVDLVHAVVDERVGQLPRKR